MLMLDLWRSTAKLKTEAAPELYSHKMHKNHKQTIQMLQRPSVWITEKYSNHAERLAVDFIGNIAELST